MAGIKLATSRSQVRRRNQSTRPSHQIRPITYLLMVACQ